MDNKSLLEYIGDINQIFSVKRYKMEGGKKQGVEAIDVSNGSGLDITILPDRGMDIYQLKFKGKCLNYLSKSGITAPQYFVNKEKGFMPTFYAGFLTTCGLENIGVTCEDEGESLAMHGSISNTPAEQVNIIYDVIDNVPAVKITGTMVSSVLFGTNLKLTRTYEIKYGVNEVSFYDEIENIGYNKSPYMILYHFNMGYPLLSEYSELVIPTKKATPRTEHAAKHADQYLQVTKPALNYEEMCYYHDIEADEAGFATVGVNNEKENLSVRITYDRSQLDHFVQWKMLGKGEYAMGLEPGNATIEGRDDARKNGTLKWLEAGEAVNNKFLISVSE